MCQNEVQNKKVDELAELLAQIFVAAIDEDLIMKINEPKNDNKKG